MYLLDRVLRDIELLLHIIDQLVQDQPCSQWVYVSLEDTILRRLREDFKPALEKHFNN